MSYLEALSLVHSSLKPSLYVEIGCRKGFSLSLARCPSVAIDPDFEIISPLEHPTRIFKQTSDAFFSRPDVSQILGAPFDLAFIDGMHVAEFALRDFINLEALAHPGSVIVIDDIVPEQMEWTTRTRETQAWTGDIYKIIPLLRKARPDLKIEVFDVQMKGLAVVSGLSPENRSLRESLDDHERFLASDASALSSVEEIRSTLQVRPVSELPALISDLARTLPRRPGGPGGPATQYIDLLKRSLLNEIYLDDELRLLYLRECLEGQTTFDYAVYHDIRDARRDAYDALAASREIGRFPERNIHKSGFSHTMMGRKRLDSLHQCLEMIRDQQIPGDLLECGVWRGGGCILMAGFLKIHGITDRRILVADSFDGLPVSTHEADKKFTLDKSVFPELAVSRRVVEENFDLYGLLSEQIIFLEGWFADTLPDVPTQQLAMLRLDGDLYRSTMDILVNTYDLVVPGGIVIVDDYGVLNVCREALTDFFASRGESVPELIEIDWTGVYFIKPGTRVEVL